MRARTKILVPVILVLAAGLFYLYVVANGYSPYVEGISLTYYEETDPDKIIDGNQYMSVTEISDEDLADVPRIKGMLDVALAQDFPPEDDGFVLFDWELNSYWINDSDGNIRVRISMSTIQTELHGDWLRESVPGYLMKYHDRYFSFSQWIA